MEVVWSRGLAIALVMLDGMVYFFDRRADDAWGLNEGECFE
jgi:hypothetical protein